MKEQKPVLVGVLAVLAAILLILSVYAFVSRNSQSETKAMIDSSVKASEDALNAAHKVEIDAVNAKVDDLAAKQAAAEAEKLKLAEEKKALEDQVAKYEADLAAEEVEVQAEACKHVLDEMLIGSEFHDVLEDNELECKLADGSVEFDGEDFDFEEKLMVGGHSVANLADNGPKDFLEIKKNWVSYQFWMQINFDHEDVGNDLDDDGVLDDDEILSITLLGSPVKIIEWDDDHIDILEGKKYFAKEGDAITIGDKVVNIQIINDDSVYVVVGEDSEIIDEGQSHKVGGLAIRVDSAMASETKTLARLTIGPEVEKTIEDGDEYAEDSAWEWRIADKMISLVLVEDYDQVDEDEDFMALSAGDKLCLPGDYLCLRYDGLTEETMLDYEFELDDGWMRVDGSFKKVSGILEVDRIYIDPSDGSIYSKDEACPGEPIEEEDDCIDFGNSIELHGTDDLILSTNGNEIFIDGLFKIDEQLNNIWVGVGGPMLNIDGDEDYLTNYGMLIKNPENALEDEKLNIEIPSDRLEYSVSVMG